MSEEEFLYRAMNIDDPMYMGDYPPAEEYPSHYEQPCQAPDWENDEFGPADCASW